MNNFKKLVSGIEQLHQGLQQSAVTAVNQLLTMRNWLIGYYIVEFEQNGKDWAEYGKSLLKTIAGNLSHIKGLDERSLRRFRLFYLYYPQLAEPIRGTLTPISQQFKIRGTLTPVLEQTGDVVKLTQQVQSGLFVPGEKL